MRKTLTRAAATCGIAALTVGLGSGVASAITPEFNPNSGYAGVQFTPTEARIVANSGASVPLEMIPRQLRSHETYGYTNLPHNHSVQQLMNEAAYNNRGIAVGVLNPVQWDGAVVYVDQTP